MTELPEPFGRLGALAGQLGMTAEELADAVLLAAAGYKGDAAASGLPVDDTNTESALPGAPQEDVPQTAVPSREQSAVGGHKVSAYGSADGDTQPGVRLTLGQAAALPQALAIGRALRPLRRRWQHGQRTELHIDATVEDYARTGLLVPHLVPMPERWLDVTVVLDRSSSMSVWDPAVDGLNKILRSLGALRTLNTWHLTWSGTDPVLHDQRGALVPVGQAGRREGQPGRRLMLVLSDCAAPGWRSGTLWKHLHVWSRTTSLALFNPLPPRLWHRTALDLPLTVTTAPEPVAPSGSWGYEPKQPRRWRRESSIRSWHAVPVIGTDPEDLRRWAQTLMRSDPEGCTAVLIPDIGRPPQRAPRRPSAARAVTPAPKLAARAEAFLQTARTPATQLAIHAAALDTFTLPILHALREQAVPEARLDDLAELLTADLCTVRRNPEADDLYTFRPEALAYLRQKLTRQTAWRTHQALTRHIASRPWTPGGLTAVLHTATGARLPTALVPFAEAADSVLRQLGVIGPTGPASASAAGPGLSPSPLARPIQLEQTSNLVGALQERLRQALQLAPQDWLAKIGLLESLTTEYVQLLGDNHPDTLSVCAHLAASYYDVGRIDEAIVIEIRVLADREETLGERHPATLSARANLATSYNDVGRIDEATAIRERVLADSEEILGERHPATLSARTNLAASYHQAGRTADATAIRERVLADSEEILGERHLDTLTARANLAASYHQAGRTADATAIHQRVLADNEEILGERHLDTLTARANLAASFYEAGRNEEAIALEERVLADSMSILGERHPDTLTAHANLAASYSRVGRAVEATAMRERVLSDSEEILGERHPATLYARANLAASYYEVGRTDEAIAIEIRVLTDSEEILGERHPDTLTARANLAASYHQAGRTAEATAMRERVLADREEILGERHPATLSAHANLAASYHQAGRTAEATAIRERVLADRVKILGDRHLDTLTARASLAASYHQAGRTAEATAMRERVLADREEILGERHPATLSAHANLAASYHQAGRTAEATAIRERVLADRVKILGDRHLDTLTARASLAASYHQAGRTAEATAMRERVLADREEILGERHPVTLSARASLAASYHQAGRTAEATAMRERVLADREDLLGGRDADTIQPVGEVSVGVQPTVSTGENPVEPVADHGAEAASDSEDSTPAAPAQRRSRARRGVAPYFFLSYARTPAYGGETAPDMWVERLFQDLCGHVMATTDLPVGTVAGFMDREMQPGDNWSEGLSEMLAACRVFVPLYSPRYFASAMCGKEWYAFEQRAIHHRARSDQPVEAIVPALWVPVPPGQLPPAAERLQFNHRYFGERYVSDGLYGLIKLEGYAQEYERAVYELAKRIVTVADTVRLDPGRSSDLRLARNAFEPPNGGSGDRKSIQITVVAPTRRKLPEGRTPEYYGGSAQDWNPYYPASTRSLAHVTEDLVRSLNYQAAITSFDVESRRPGGRRQPDSPEILLIDPWALRDEERRHRLAAFDANNQPWTTLIVPRNRDDGQSQAAEAQLTEQLEQTMPVTMRRGRSFARAGLKGVPTLEAFGQLLPQMVEAAFLEYRRHTMAQPPAD
ncbi:TIR-like protein FxsC [Streptomyces sp. NPDC008312]|uniref:TIR-like protein FxsC n=1 Tax=Streptomyces sp. NPDC008312 TaxID=3364825 RepID=UPI0036DFF41F